MLHNSFEYCDFLYINCKNHIRIIAKNTIQADKKHTKKIFHINQPKQCFFLQNDIENVTHILESNVFRRSKFYLRNNYIMKIY